MKDNFEIKFCESLLEDNPNCIGALMFLGGAYTEAGFYREGLEIDERLLRLRPEDEVVNYNLACSLSLTGQLDKALRALKRSVLLGYDDFSHILDDCDLAGLRDTPGFRSFFSKLKRLGKKNV